MKSIIQIGPMNTMNYDVTITLLDTVRGEKAIHLLQSAGPVDGSGSRDTEYLLALIRFELQGRAVTDTGSFELGDSPFQWIAYSSDFRKYESSPVTPPEPMLKGEVEAGEKKEGWLAFEVDKSEPQPVLVFDPSSGGAIGRGSKLFFRLY